MENRTIKLTDEEMEIFRRRYDEVRVEVLKQYPTRKFSHERVFPWDINDAIYSADSTMPMERFLIDGREVLRSEYEDELKFAQFEYQAKMRDLTDGALRVLSEMGHLQKT